jgi:hypothetical protein
LLALLREENCLAAKTLAESGVSLASAREALRTTPHDNSKRFIRERSPLPEDVVELQDHIRSIKTRMEEAIAAHDFDKAQFCSDEEGKESDKLYLLYLKYGLKDWILD